jgi:hypothetical protein
MTEVLAQVVPPWQALTNCGANELWVIKGVLLLGAGDLVFRVTQGLARWVHPPKPPPKRRRKPATRTTWWGGTRPVKRRR